MTTLELRDPHRGRPTWILLVSLIAALSCAQVGDEPPERDAATYTLQIVFRGLIGFVPVSTGAIDDQKNTDGMWALLVNATEGRAPCAEYGPAFDRDPMYHRHYPYLSFDRKNLAVSDESGALRARGGSTEPEKRYLLRQQVELQLDPVPEPRLALGAGAGAACSKNNKSYACLTSIASFAPHLAAVCASCVAESTVPRTVAARVRLRRGEVSVSSIAKNNEGKPYRFAFPNTGKVESVEVEGEGEEEEWRWSDYQPCSGELCEQAQFVQELGTDVVVTVEDLRGPTTLLISDLDGGAGWSPVRLLPVGHDGVVIVIENLTRFALGQTDDYVPQVYEGRELRWYYSLSENLPHSPEDCRTVPLPSLEKLNDDFGPPICQAAAFLP